jgi:hypothetical protein
VEGVFLSDVFLENGDGFFLKNVEFPIEKSNQKIMNIPIIEHEKWGKLNGKKLAIFEVLCVNSFTTDIILG